MNPRILELFTNPEIIQTQDLEIIEKEIYTKPYTQGLRALFLLGTHRFKPENYHRELSKTAAYTTDKKILYQLINGKKVEAISEEKFEEKIIKEEKVVEQLVETNVLQYGFITTSKIPEQEDRSSLIDQSEPEVFEKIEEEMTSETVLETQVEQKEINETTEGFGQEIENQKTKFEEIEEYEAEGIINKDDIKNGKREMEDPSQLSFHGLQEFLPEIKIESKETKILTVAPEQPTLNKHDEEMKRLIAEVEAKMKSKKSLEKSKEREAEKEERHDNTEISFAETQSFEPIIEQEKNSPIVEQEVPIESVPQIEKIDLEAVNTKAETISTGWKPMDFKNSVPDALISKKETGKVENTTTNSVQKEEKSDDNVSEKTEIQVINVSFFAPTIENIEEKQESKTIETKKEEIEQSNIPTFINTWQSWLKIDRKMDLEEATKPRKEEPKKIEVKAKVIEKFIETEPKISQLKEESNYVVKEKKTDISRLMTETLAKLYTEQKLYAKAIKAYETLSQKHPEKAEYFAGKIQEVKEIKSNNS